MYRFYNAKYMNKTTPAISRKNSGALESLAEHEVEMPAIGPPVARKHVVESVAVVEADEADGVDLQTCAETGRTLQAEKVPL